MAEEKTKEIVEPRIIEVKSSDKPPIGKFYFGDIIEPYGLRPVNYRYSRFSSARFDDKGNPATVLEDRLDHFERIVKSDNDLLSMVYYHKQPPYRVPDDGLIPVAQWNITADMLDSVDVVPYWKTFPVVIDGRRPRITPDAKGKSTTLMLAFHWVILNTGYVPNVNPMGSSDDGHWVMGDPAVGSWINQQLDNEEHAGVNTMAYTRRRVG